MGTNFGNRSLYELLFDPKKYDGGTVTVKDVKIVAMNKRDSETVTMIVKDKKKNVLEDILPVKLSYSEIDFISRIYMNNTLPGDTVTITGKFEIKETVPYINAKKLVNDKFKIKTTDEIYHNR